MSPQSPASLDQRIQYQVDVRRDMRIPTSDPGITLSADAWLPVSDEPVPAVVMLLPYRKDLKGGAGNEPSFRYFARHGYACLLVDIQGTGSSDGPVRSMLDAEQAEDGVNAIEWVADQSWCTGAVGMWGMCAGGLSTLFAASRRPPQLRATIAIMNPYDVGRDAMHHDGARSDVHNLVRRAGNNLLLHLLPPLINPTSVSEQRRWQNRLHQLDPSVLVGNRPQSDPVWREWAIEPGTIVAPTLCVGGWHDLYTNALLAAYEQIKAPKKLLVGPWMHTMPQSSPYDAIDFLPMALRWWDYWLCEIGNGVMDEPAATVYVQGARPGWRTYDSWPPATEEVKLSASGDAPLAEPKPGQHLHRTDPIGEYRPDPTIGALSGLSRIGSAGWGLPLDQHDDDSRSLTSTSQPLTEDILIAGRPAVFVHLADDPGPVQRLVARLTAVDPHGRSTLIVSGVVCPNHPEQAARIELQRTVYRIPAGHRLRVALSDSDFPRLRPLTNPTPIRVAGIELTLPIAAEDAGDGVDLPPINNSAATTPGFGGHWTINRDPVNDGIEVTFGSKSAGSTSGEGHRFEFYDRTSAIVRRATPEAAVTTGDYRAVVHMTTGETVTATAHVRCTRATLWVRGDVLIDDMSIFSHDWAMPISDADNDDLRERDLRPSDGRIERTQATTVGSPALGAGL